MPVLWISDHRGAYDHNRFRRKFLSFGSLLSARSAAGRDWKNCASGQMTYRHVHIFPSWCWVAVRLRYLWHIRSCMAPWNARARVPWRAACRHCGWERWTKCSSNATTAPGIEHSMKPKFSIEGMHAKKFPIGQARDQERTAVCVCVCSESMLMALSMCESVCDREGERERVRERIWREKEMGNEYQRTKNCSQYLRINLPKRIYNFWA